MNTPSQSTPTAIPAVAEAKVIADLARAGVQKHASLDLSTWTPEKQAIAPRLIWPDKSITDLEGALPCPLRKRAKAQLGAVDSFIAYVETHQEAGTVVVGDANEKGGGFIAILDYHESRQTGVPRWAEHTVTFALEPTPEWVRWLGICGRDLDQRTFAEFIEDNAADIVPSEGDAGTSASALMSVATTLQVKTDIRFASGINLQNGQVQLRYEECINGTWGGDNGMAVPQAFHIGVVPFRGGERYAVRVRLRYRGTGGKAIFRLELERPHQVVEAAFKDTKAKIETALVLTVLVGSITSQARPVV
jgi:uncharacterized protein YfdQ (DUF2303 family)